MFMKQDSSTDVIVSININGSVSVSNTRLGDFHDQA